MLSDLLSGSGTLLAPRPGACLGVTQEPQNVVSRHKSSQAVLFCSPAPQPPLFSCPLKNIISRESEES